MEATSKVLLIFASGPKIGYHIARTFLVRGYKIALAARYVDEEDSTSERLYVRCELSDPASIIEVYKKVEATIGIPTVVVYNVRQDDMEHPLSPELTAPTRYFDVSELGPYVAAQQAALAFARLPETASRTFILVGSLLDQVQVDALADLGVSRSAVAHIVHSVAESYKFRGFKFYCDDERRMEGATSVSDIDGESLALHYLYLAEEATQELGQQTFVNGDSDSLSRPSDSPREERTSPQSKIVEQSESKDEARSDKT